MTKCYLIFFKSNNQQNLKVNLYVSLYPEKNQNRFKEIEKCLIQNINNSSINQIMVFNEGFQSEYLNHTKILNIQFPKRPFFSDFYPFLDNAAINIISNNDIYFDHTLLVLNNLNLKYGDFIALTRKENDGSLFRAVIGDSQDTWIMLGKPNVLKYCNFYMGVPGCDNLIAYRFFESGYRVLNPSKTINCWHVHESELRSYSETNRLLQLYLFVKPTGLLGFHFNRLLLVIFYFIKQKLFNIKDFR